LSSRGNSLLNSFNWAFEGIVHALRRERNMKIHFAISVIVLGAAMFLSLSRLEIVALFVAISFVLITEMINSAIEHTVDLITREDDPRAKIAKDMAAGAVLVAAANALVVAYLVFYDKLSGAPYDVLTKLRNSPTDVSVIAMVVVIFAAIVFKAISGRGTPLRGGLPSGHAAVSFAGWVAVTFIAADTATSYALPISVIALLMAGLTAQSRVQAGIHSVLEVALGALLGIVVTLFIFKVWFPL
jgi:diacylglycerol kinase (ATP)